MADVTLVQSGANNGTVTPATPGSLTTTAGNLLVLVIAALGTSPTLTTPASWTQLQKTSGATLTVGVYAFPNNTGGATNPSSTIGGTVTGWVATMFEFSQTGANCGVQESGQFATTSAAPGNLLANKAGQTLPNMLYVYSVARATATLTAANTVLPWSSSVQGQAGVQGLSVDFFWASTLSQSFGPQPSIAGTLSASVAVVQTYAIFNTTATQPSVGDSVGGLAGRYVGPQFAGMIGG